MLLSKEDKKKAVEVSMKGAGLEEILESLKGSDTLEFKDGYLYDPFNDSVAPMKLQIEGSSSVPLDIIKNKKTISQNMKMSTKMKRKAFSGPGGLRKSLDGEALDNRSLSLERKDFNSLNLRELDLVFAFASPLIFRDPITLKEEQLQVLNYREEFRRIDNIFTDLQTKVAYKKVWATMQNLANVLVVKPKILHFSGHGKRGAGEGENDFLVLEKENFENDNLTGKMIKELFAQNKEKDDMIKVAVVLSCESQKVGEVFENAGIEGVLY